MPVPTSEELEALSYEELSDLHTSVSAMVMERTRATVERMGASADLMREMNVLLMARLQEAQDAADRLGTDTVPDENSFVYEPETSDEDMGLDGPEDDAVPVVMVRLIPDDLDDPEPGPPNMMLPHSLRAGTPGSGIRRALWETLRAMPSGMDVLEIHRVMRRLAGRYEEAEVVTALRALLDEGLVRSPRAGIFVAQVEDAEPAQRVGLSFPAIELRRIIWEAVRARGEPLDLGAIQQAVSTVASAEMTAQVVEQLVREGQLGLAGSDYYLRVSPVGIRSWVLDRGPGVTLEQIQSVRPPLYTALAVFQAVWELLHARQLFLDAEGRLFREPPSLPAQPALLTLARQVWVLTRARSYVGAGPTLRALQAVRPGHYTETGISQAVLQLMLEGRLLLDVQGRLNAVDEEPAGTNTSTGAPEPRSLSGLGYQQWVRDRVRTYLGDDGPTIAEVQSGRPDNLREEGVADAIQAMVWEGQLVYRAEDGRLSLGAGLRSDLLSDSVYQTWVLERIRTYPGPRRLTLADLHNARPGHFTAEGVTRATTQLLREGRLVHSGGLGHLSLPEAPDWSLLEHTPTVHKEWLLFQLAMEPLTLDQIQERRPTTLNSDAIVWALDQLVSVDHRVVSHEGRYRTIKAPKTAEEPLSATERLLTRSIIDAD